MNFNFLILAIGAKSALIGDIVRDIGRDDTLKTILMDQGPGWGGSRTPGQGFQGIIPSVQDDIGAMFKRHGLNLDQPTLGGALGWNSLGWNLDHWIEDLWNETDDDSITGGPVDENDDLKSNNLNSEDWDMEWKRSSFFPFEDRELPTFAIVY